MYTLHLDEWRSNWLINAHQKSKFSAFLSSGWHFLLDSHTSQMQTTVPDLDPEQNVTLKHAAILVMLFENWGVISEEGIGGSTGLLL